MKTLIFKNISIAVLLLSLISCESLTEDPKDFIEPKNFFTTVDDLDAATVAAFRPLLRGEGWDGLSVRSWTLVAGADDLTSNRGLNKDRILEFDDFKVSSDNVDVKLTWKSLYASIAAANLVISNKENVKSEIEKRDRIVGQAHYIRALSYFYLVRFYGGVPLMLEPSLDGVMDKTRASVEEVYNQIIADAEEAGKVLPEVKSWDDAPGRPTLGAVQTLLANVYITMAGWPLKQTAMYEQAATMANSVMQSGVYALEESYENLWAYDNRNGKEQIFNLQTAREFGAPYTSYTSLPYNPIEENGWRDFACEIAFFNSFPDDERKPVTFKTVFVNPGTGLETPWENSVDGKPAINKYSSTGTDGLRTHLGGALFPVFRYAEVILIYAESINETDGPTADAYNAINMIRRRANGLDINTPNATVDLTEGLSKEDFRDAVLRERSYEFAYEQNRWFDLVRREMVKEANANHPFINPEIITSDNYLAPIPGVEREINPKLTQNPGY